MLSRIVPWLEAPSPKNATPTPLVPLNFAASAAPQISGRTGADDAVRAHHPLVQVGYVHGTTLAAAGAGRLAVDLRHHPDDVDTLGNTVTMAAVRARYPVLVGQVQADAGRYRFFTRIQMHEPGYLARSQIPRALALRIRGSLS